MLTIPNIITSVENKNSLVLDEHAKNGIFARNEKGQLKKHSGGFSVVFPYETTEGEKWAFRCWHGNVGISRKRYQTISEAIKNANLSFLCQFQYIDKGICVDGIIYPTTRMRWIDGLTIKNYICQNKESKDLLVGLANNFLEMCKTMHSKSLAHGDLQHGNILVDKNHKLFLVDYDSFYCPELKGEADTVTGLVDYQHPSRSKNKYTSEKIDYFSELIIYLSILAIAENPTLVDKYKVENADRLLFCKEDYTDLKASAIYKDISALSSKCKLLLDILEEYLNKTTLDELEPFDVLYAKRTTKPQIVSFECASKKAKVCVGQKILFKWETKDATQVFFNDKLVSGNFFEWTEKNVGINKYVLKASNGFAEDTRVLTLEAVRPASISLRTSSKVIHSNSKENVVISWDVKDAQKVFLDYGYISEEVSAQGKETFTPNETTTYTILAIGHDTTTTSTKSIEVVVAEEAQIMFDVNPKYAFRGTPVVLSWSVRHAKKVVLEGHGEQEFTGEKDICFDKDRAFTLTIRDAFGEKKKTVEITEIPLPQIKCISIPTPVYNINIKIKMPHVYIDAQRFKNKIQPKLSNSISNAKLSNNLLDRFREQLYKHVYDSLPQIKNLENVFGNVNHYQVPSLRLEFIDLFKHYYKKINSARKQVRKSVKVTK